MFLVPIYALVVAAPAGPDQGCPSPRQITEALNARVPEVVVPAGDAWGTSGLRVAVTGGAPPAPMHVEIIDQNGEARLQRTLQPADRGRPIDCAALAETVALIVERYLHEVGYELPPSPPPAPAPPPEAAPAPEMVIAAARPVTAPRGGRVDLLLEGAWRGASTGSQPEAALGLGVEGGFGGWRLGAALTAGVAPSQSARLPSGTASLRRFPLHLALFVALPVGPGALEPGVGVGVDWLVTQVASGHDSTTLVRASPTGDLALGYRIFFGSRVFARAGASLALAVPYQFVVPAPPSGAAGSPGSEPVFSSPRVFFKSGIELGFSFR